MKRHVILACLAAALAASPALAQFKKVTVTNPTVTAGDLNSTSTSQADQNVQGIDANLNTYFEAADPLRKTTTTLRSAPDVAPPSIVGGNPCMVSASVGGSFIGGGFGVGLGIEDHDCEVRQQVALFVNMGLTDAGMLHFCLHNEDVQETFAALGYTCQQAEAAMDPAKDAIRTVRLDTQSGRTVQGAVIPVSSGRSTHAGLPASAAVPPQARPAPAPSLTAACPQASLDGYRRTGAAWTDYTPACRARVEAGL